MIYGNMVGGAGLAQSYILQDPDGNEIPAVLVDNETKFDATPNDIREGKVAATDRGVITGEKEIPAYHTTEGCEQIDVGKKVTIHIKESNRYNFTKLQAIVCRYNNSMEDSVGAEKVSINGSVYDVGTDEAIARVTIDHENQSINLGITNNGLVPYVVRYFTYKEEP